MPHVVFMMQLQRTRRPLESASRALLAALLTGAFALTACGGSSEPAQHPANDAPERTADDERDRDDDTVEGAAGDGAEALGDAADTAADAADDAADTVETTAEELAHDAHEALEDDPDAD